MNLNLFKKLHAEGLISDESLQRIIHLDQRRLFSLHWELKTILYLGVLLLSGGLGVLVYKNIDTIGHQAVLVFIALVCAGCFYYCFQKKAPFSPLKVQAPNAVFDYILLLGCLSFVTFLGYWQYAYNVFGTAYGLATFIPMLVLFFCAYYFDHLGILSLAITNLAAWAGIAITPLHILKDNDFDTPRLIYTGLVLGGLLVLLGLVSHRRDFKRHFEFTYTNFGLHLLFIAGLAGLFAQDSFYLGWLLLILAIAYYFYRQAMNRRSFYFFLVLTCYAYIALSYVVVHLLFATTTYDTTPIYLGLLYFIFSAIGVIRILMIVNKKMKTHDSL